MRIVGRVLELWRYPVSSLQGEMLDELRLEEGGVAGDRICGLFDAQTDSIASPDREKRWRTAAELAARTRDGKVEIRAGNGWHEIEAAEAAASESLGFPVRFLRYGSVLRDGAVSKPRYDHAGLHIVTTASLRTLGQLAPAGSQVDRRRFRPNIVVETDGALEGFIEKDWIGTTISIGETRIGITEPCERCSFVALAQGDLGFAPPVLHTVARHGGGGFGVLAKAENSGSIHVGDAVVVR